MKTKKPIRLSASRLNTHNSCSWIYFCQYILKIKSPSNSGSSRGDVAHRVFECLLNEKRKTLVDKILKAKTITVHPPLARFVERQLKAHGLETYDKKKEHNFNLTDEMIVTGLSLDFYCDGWELEPPELKFTYKGNGYELLGFIDKAAKRNNEAVFKDYKSSASKYEGEELEFNIQSLIYSLWSYKERGVIPFIQFIFLRFQDDPYIEKHYTKDELEGFAEYLSYITTYLTDFTFQKAIANMAVDKGFTKDSGFTGRVMCGRSKSPTDTKKDGGLMYSCAQKWPYKYYSVYDKDGELLYSDKKLPTLKNGERMEEKQYLGCYYFNKQNYPNQKLP